MTRSSNSLSHQLLCLCSVGLLLFANQSENGAYVSAFYSAPSLSNVGNLGRTSSFQPTKGPHQTFTSPSRKHVNPMVHFDAECNEELVRKGGRRWKNLRQSCHHLVDRVTRRTKSNLFQKVLSSQRLGTRNAAAKSETHKSALWNNRSRSKKQTIFRWGASFLAICLTTLMASPVQVLAAMGGGMGGGKGPVAPMSQ